ncbi:MAG: hemolysin family protein [Candidatus Omnitrophica bacterium]|nr:hemolysin family protein [Candidatus Omnitrophota bacterium]
MNLTTELIAFLLLVILSAFFSSSESAFFSLNPVHIHRIRAKHQKAAERIEQILVYPTRLLFSLLIGNTFVNVLISILGYSILNKIHPPGAPFAAIPLVTVILLIFGEVTPKRIALHMPERIAVNNSWLLQFIIWIMTPLRKLMDLLTVRLEKVISPQKIKLTEEEFRTALNIGEEQGFLDREERIMVEGIIRLEGLRASDVMTPRVNLIGIDLDDEFAENIIIAKSSRRKYLPVFHESIDKIHGFLDVKKFLLSEPIDLESSIFNLLLVPETMPLDNLLTTMRKEKQSIACVKDEFGGTAGIITQGDILEEIIADVSNLRTHDNQPIRRLGSYRWLVDGITSLEDINYNVGLELESEDVDRLSGWVAAHLERLPKPKDVVEAQGCRVFVRSVEQGRVCDAIIEKLVKEKKDD